MGNSGEGLGGFDGGFSGWSSSSKRMMAANDDDDDDDDDSDTCCCSLPLIMQEADGPTKAVADGVRKRRVSREE